MECNEILDKKKKILDNINSAKKMNINKVSALLVCNEGVEKELLNWLIYEGYKVNLIRDDFNILTIEW